MFKKLFKPLLFILLIFISATFGYFLNSFQIENIINKERNQQTTYEFKRHLYFTAEEKYVKHLGRTVFYDDCLWFSMSGSGIEFITNANSVNITLLCENSESLTYNHRPRIAVLVNGTIMLDTILTKSEEMVTVDLSNEIGEKVVSVIKLSESMYSSCAISKISVYSDCDIKPTEEKKLKLEFIGDSITCGYGIDETNPNGYFSTETENFIKTYAYLTSQKLSADYSAVSFSGYGVYKGYSTAGNNGAENVLSKYYESAITSKTFNSTYPFNKWNFSQYRPDIVVINLGVNDAVFCTDTKSKNSFVNAYKELIGLIRWHNPNAYILCILGEVNNSMFPYIEQAVSEYSNENSDLKIYTNKIDFKMNEYGSVIDGHPNEQSNQVASQQLCEIIKDILNDDKAYKDFTNNIQE